MKKLLIFVGIVVLSVSLFSQAGTAGRGKLRGIVLDAQTGQPIEGVTVKLYSLKARAYLRPFPKTNKEGKWKALYIRGGMWNIDFEKVGYETVKTSVKVDTAPGRKRPIIKIAMKKIEGPVLEQSIVKEIEKGQNLLSQNKTDEALKLFLDIASKNQDKPGIAIVNLYIGNCYSKKEDYEKAIEYYKKALKKYPKNKNLILSIGNAYTNMKNEKAAMEWFNKLSFEDINNPDTLYNIGVSFYNAYKYDKAVKYFEKATKVNPDFADAYYLLGMTYTGMNKIPEAIKALERFMELAPDSPNYNTAKAVVDAFKKSK